MLAAGRLNTLISIERQDVTRGPGNEKIVSWVTHINETWAEIKPMSAALLFAAQAAQSKARVLVTIRYRQGIDRTMRVRRLRDGAVFAIEGDPQPDDRSGMEWLTLSCSSGINDGR